MYVCLRNLKSSFNSGNDRKKFFRQSNIDKVKTIAQFVIKGENNDTLSD